MICPECSSESKVINSRDNRRSTYRRRECLNCGNRWSTFEVLHVVGMDPYPMCKARRCFKPVDKDSNGLPLCQKHFREWDNKRRKGEKYKAKRRQSLKLKRMREESAKALALVRMSA